MRLARKLFCQVARWHVNGGIVVGALLTLVFAGNAAAQLPRPTNQNLARLGYFYADGRWGDDVSTVWPYTNLYVAIGSGASFSEDPNWQAVFASLLERATLNHKAIYLYVGNDPNLPWINDDTILDVAQNYWGQVAYIDVFSEVPESFTAEQMEQRIAIVAGKIAARGLSPRPFGATIGDPILTTNAILAPSLSFVNVEAYVPCPNGTCPSDPNPQVHVDYLNGFLATAKNRLHNAGKKIFLTMQAYDRNGLWTNVTTLEALQRPVYLNAYADPDVLGILMFAFNRTGGSKDHPELQQAHREIGSVMGISPAMNIDAPANGSTVSQTFFFGGWAIDRAAVPTGGTGVDTLHVWAFPTNGAPPIFVGVPTYGGHRPDVGAAFGPQFAYSGFGIIASLPPGQYWIVGYPHSSVSGTFVKEQVYLINVQ